MKHKQLGFGVLEVLLICVIVGALGFAGWWVLSGKNSGKDTNSTKSVETKTYTDTANVYSLSYPSDWTATFPEYGRDFAEDTTVPAEDWTKTSRPLELKAPDASEGNHVTVYAGCESYSIGDTKSRKDHFHTQTEMEINGYAAIYDRLAFDGDAEDYLHHTYVLEHDGKCVSIGFRENHHHPMSNRDFDDAKLVPAFEKIVNSIRFLN